ncbi:MAG: energy transducer TonB, partial [Polyangia bacterium]
MARANDEAAPTSSGVAPPTVLEQQQPAYPLSAADSGARGDVAVNVEIDSDGNVTGVALAHGVDPRLDHAAMEAASHWRFRPALRDGVAVPSRVQLLFHFEPPPAPTSQPTAP